MLLRLVEHLILGMCFFSLNLIFISFVALFRNVPAILHFIQIATWRFLRGARSVYHWLLSRINPFCQNLFGVDLFGDRTRVAATVLLSMTIGISITMITDISINLWFIALFIVHGFLVGVMWHQLGDPHGLRLGVDLQ